MAWQEDSPFLNIKAPVQEAMNAVKKETAINQRQVSAKLGIFRPTWGFDYKQQFFDTRKYGAGNEEKNRLQLWAYVNSLLKIRRMTIGQAKAYQQKVNEPLCLTDVLIVGKLRITAYL